MANIDQLVADNGLEQLKKLTVEDSLHTIRAEEQEIRALVQDMRRAFKVKIEYFVRAVPCHAVCV